MTKKIPKLLSMVLVVALMAAIPASTQILNNEVAEAQTDESTDVSTASNLPLLILINRLGLSEEQMRVLHQLLSDLLVERDAMASFAAEFENTMIAFQGTEEELDELVAGFREGQQALREALAESVEAALDEVRDVLSINQGLVLQDALPQLLGNAVVGTGQGRTMMMESRLPSGAMARRGLMQLRGSVSSSRDDEMASDSQAQLGLGQRMAGRTQANADGMTGQRLGRILDQESAQTMREQRLQQLGELADGVSEDIVARLGERMAGVIEELGVQMGRRSMIEQSGDGAVAGNGMTGQRAGARTAQRMQMLRNEGGNLFEVFEQVRDVLELKLEAME